MTRFPADLRLELEELACTRGERPIFSKLTLDLPGGTALAITGRNGAGKSSLLRAVAGLIRPSSGTVRLAGGDPERGVGEQAHYVGHADALKSALTAHENLADWQAMTGPVPQSIWHTPDEALEALGIARLRDLPAGYASAGQRRRLALARLLLNARPLWLLDEPTAALDAATQDWLLAAMAGHMAVGGLILAATHAPLDLPGLQHLEMPG